MSVAENKNSPKEGIQDEKDISKQTFRRQVWERLDKNDISAFPKPYGRIPNFKGAEQAAAKLLELEEFHNAKAVEVNPDKPLEYARIIVLENNKDLYVPIPRLKNCLLKKLPKEDNNKDIKKIVSRWGIENMGLMVDLEDEVHINLFVLGSVAVSKQGYRIGKGKGYADLEFAILKDMKAVDDNTVIVTIVHDTQVFDELPIELFQKHDIPVDYILTPTQIIKVDNKLPRPKKIFWNLLSQRKLNLMKTLQKLKQKHESKGIDTTLKEVDSDVEGNEIKMKQRKFRRPFRKIRKASVDTDNVEENPDRKTYRRKFYRRKSVKKEVQTGSSTEATNKDGLENSEKSSPRKRRNSKRPYRRFHIDFSLLVSNIERNVRVRDLKNALNEHGIKPDDITWKGYKGFCYLHYAKPFNKNNDKENEIEKSFSVDNVIEVLQSLKICPDSPCNLEVKVMEPITRIETTDVTSV